MRGLRQRALAEPVRAQGLAGTAALHLLVVATFVLAGGLGGHPRLPAVYRVTLIAPLGPAVAATAAPAAPASAPRARAAPPAPAPKVAPRSREPAVPLERPRTARAPATVAPPPARTKAPPRPQPAAAAAAAPAPATSPAGSPGGSDATTIRTEGVEFPFPGYLHNLVAQVYRQWRPPPSNALLEAEVFFLVHRDGSVSGLEFIRRSGSFAFDLEAQGAIEAAARADAFGPLPAGYGPDLLPVSFFFNPRAPQ